MIGDWDLDGGANGNDFLSGGDGDDEISGDGGNDIATGGIGNDTIDGGAGNDQLYGGEGNDVIFGDHGFAGIVVSGNDTLSGGAGTDIFGFYATLSGSKDAIQDFSKIDILYLPDLLESDANSVDVGASKLGNILISFDNGGSIELLGLQNKGVSTLAQLDDLITVVYGD